jgi:hypothetical protein
MGYLGTKPANSPLTSELIPDGIITPADLSQGKPVWDTSGNVGIGTSSPASTLDVVATGVATGTIRSTSTSGSREAKLRLNVPSTGGDDPSGQIEFTYGTGYTVAGSIQMTHTNPNMKFFTGTNERMRLDNSGNLLFNSGYGSVATAYGCRAWVNFNGTGTVAIRSSGNVSSITDNGTGTYTVNFTTAMSDANYSVNANSIRSGSNTPQIASVSSVTAQTTTAARIITMEYSSSLADGLYVNVAVFR